MKMLRQYNKFAWKSDDLSGPWLAFLYPRHMSCYFSTSRHGFAVSCHDNEICITVEGKTNAEVFSRRRPGTENL